jgi:hypothetical protein
MKIAKRLFEDVAMFKYKGTMLMVQNCMHKEINSRPHSGNACYHSVQSLPSSCLLCKNTKIKIYITIILPVVLYGYETYTLREDHRLRVFQKSVPNRIFGPKRGEVMGEWRKLHNGMLHNLYSSPDIIRQLKSRRTRWAGHVAHMGEGKNVHRVLVGKPEGERPFERPRCRWDETGTLGDWLVGCGVDSPGSG